MKQTLVKCPACGDSVSSEFYNSTAEYTLCFNCGGKLLVHAFPALYRREKEGAAAEKALLDDAVCFYHANKKAERVCDECGRFLCGLCELPFGEETLCASCLEQRRKQPGRHRLKARQMRYDKLALMLAVLPIIMWYLTCITAPAALFVVLRYWKKDQEFSPGRKVRMALAFIIALLQVIGWIVGIVFIIGEIANGR